MESLENRMDELAKEISLLDVKIEEKKRYIIDGDILKKHLTEFKEAFDGLKPDEKERMVRLLVRELTYNDDKKNKSVGFTRNRLIFRSYRLKMAVR